MNEYGDKAENAPPTIHPERIRSDIYHILTRTPFHIASKKIYLWPSDVAPIAEKIMEMITFELNAAIRMAIDSERMSSYPPVNGFKAPQD